MPTVARGLFKWMFRRSASLEDLADRLNHFWTFGLLLLFAGIISWRQTYTNPIHCRSAKIEDSKIAYINDICWNSYFIVDAKEISKLQKPKSKEQVANAKEQKADANAKKQEKTSNDKLSKTSEGYSFAEDHFSYVFHNHPNNERPDSYKSQGILKRTLYQWLPLILCLQALLFKLPNLIMYVLHSYSGINFDKLAGLTNGYENLTLQDRSILSRRIGRYLYNWCQQCDNCLPWRHLTCLWFLTKVLYCINILTQFSLVDGFLAPGNTTSFGDVIYGNLFTDDAYVWKGASAFPKDVVCHFDFIRIPNKQTRTFQCSLTANYFSEFAYMFIWVWLLFVAVVTCLSLITWVLTTMSPILRTRYVGKALQSIGDDEFDMNLTSDSEIRKFCDFLGEDGVLALKLTGANASEIIVSEVIQNMWNVWSASFSSSCIRGGHVINSPTYQNRIYQSLDTCETSLTEQKRG